MGGDEGEEMEVNKENIKGLRDITILLVKCTL